MAPGSVDWFTVLFSPLCIVLSDSLQRLMK
uniref:Uncharacterized protein n=1 Tax=Arundo donax TaxID=35708 RepID=A0A0A8Y0C5_ARUDO